MGLPRAIKFNCFSSLQFEQILVFGLSLLVLKLNGFNLRRKRVCYPWFFHFYFDYFINALKFSHIYYLLFPCFNNYMLQKIFFKIKTAVVYQNCSILPINQNICLIFKGNSIIHCKWNIKKLACKKERKSL